MANYLISSIFDGSQVSYDWGTDTYYYNSMDPNQNAAFSGLAMAFTGSPTKVTVLAGEYTASMSGGYFYNGAEMTISNQAYTTQPTPYVSTTATVTATLNNAGSFIVKNVDESAATTVSFVLNPADGAFNNTGSVLVDGATFKADTVSNAANKFFTLTAER